MYTGTIGTCLVSSCLQDIGHFLLRSCNSLIWLVQVSSDELSLDSLCSGYSSYQKDFRTISHLVAFSVFAVVSPKNKLVVGVDFTVVILHSHQVEHWIVRFATSYSQWWFCRALPQRRSGHCVLSERGWCYMSHQELLFWMNSLMACGLMSNLVLAHLDASRYWFISPE